MAAYYGPVPEPDPGQSYNKYHWVATAMQKIRNECPRAGTQKAGTQRTGNFNTLTGKEHIQRRGNIRLWKKFGVFISASEVQRYCRCARYSSCTSSSPPDIFCVKA